MTSSLVTSLMVTSSIETSLGLIVVTSASDVISGDVIVSDVMEQCLSDVINHDVIILSLPPLLPQAPQTGSGWTQVTRGGAIASAAMMDPER